MAFDPQGIVRLYWCTTAPADKAAPTVAEITAGVRVDAMTVPNGMTGFTSSPGYTDSTSLADTVEQKVPSLATVQEGKLVMKAAKAAGDAEKTAYDAFTLGGSGCMIRVLAGAPVAAGLCHVYETVVANKSVDDGTGKQLATATVDFAPGKMHLYSVIAA